VDKWFLKSKTIWGGLILAVPALVEAFGVDLSAEEITDLGSTVTALLDHLHWLVGFGLVWWGRQTAAGKLTLGTGK